MTPVTVIHGDSREKLKELDADSIDACVTDPPYGLQFMGKEWDRLWRNGTDADQAYVERTSGQLTSRARKLPDYSAAKPVQVQQWHEEWAREVLRVLKPGAHLVAFSGTRTYHRMVCAIEDAGFEIRDQIGWAFGQGFPKGHDAERAIAVVTCRRNGRHFASTLPPQEKRLPNDHICDQTPESEPWDGWNVALKPAWEPIVLARKPLSASTVAANVLRWGTGALNVDGCRVGDFENDIPSGLQRFRTWSDFHTGDNRPEKPSLVNKASGRWPANLILEGDENGKPVEEVLAGFPETKSGELLAHHKKSGNGLVGSSTFAIRDRTGEEAAVYGDSGSAARFFYTAKADSDDRCGSRHPTVKPVDLMQYLVRLVAPKGSVVLDCFAGSGTTGEAAIREGMRAILIERESQYVADIHRRISLALAGPEERARAIIKVTGKEEPVDDLPLFGKSTEAA